MEDTVLRTNGEHLLLNAQPLASSSSAINGFYLKDGHLICQYTGIRPNMELDDRDHVIWTK